MKFLCLAVALISQSLWAHEALETKSFRDVSIKVSQLRSKFGARNVLLVFDIDNTLLKARQPLGSDQWFEWQAEAIKQGSSDASFKTVDELLSAQADFYQLSSMDLTDRDIPQIVSQFKSSGHQIVLLTSRSPSLRNVTERELTKNSLSFRENTIMNGIPFEFLEAPFKNSVSFMNGIFMTAGHHKGEALDYILKKAGKKFKAIVFVDDLERHTRRVYETFEKSTDTEIITFRYGKQDDEVLDFKNGSKSLVRSQSAELQNLIRRIFKK